MNPENWSNKIELTTGAPVVNLPKRSCVYYLNLIGFIELCISSVKPIAKTIILNIVRLMDLQQQLLNEYIIKERMTNPTFAENLTDNIQKKLNVDNEELKSKVKNLSKTDERDKLYREIETLKNEYKNIKSEATQALRSLENKNYDYMEIKEEITELKSKYKNMQIKKEEYKKKYGDSNDNYNKLEKELIETKDQLEYQKKIIEKYNKEKVVSEHAVVDVYLEYKYYIFSFILIFHKIYFIKLFFVHVQVPR